MNDFQKSIKAILYDRIVSPLSGTFILTWLIWNWKLVYYFFIFDQGQSVTDKISYIENNYNNWRVLGLYPILSAIFFITIYPFISTGAYWIHLRFREWQNRIKNQIENNRLLTLDESILIRIEIKNQQERFLELEKKKDDRIRELEIEIERFSKMNKDSKQFPTIAEIEEILKENPKKKMNDEEKSEMEDFLKSKNIQYFDSISQAINNNLAIHPNKDFNTIINNFLVHDLIKKIDEVGHYVFTDKGKKYLKEYLKRKK